MARAKPKKTLPVPPAPDCPGIDRTPDLTNWLARWANLTALVKFAASEACALACAVRPGAFAYDPSLAVLGIDLERMNKIDAELSGVRGSVRCTPFKGIVGRIGDGMLDDAAEKGGAS